MRRSDRKLGAAGGLLVYASLALTPSATAQTNERAYESLEFRVVTPGARAVGMGKTFVGMADDATAAASNPAGLSNLLDAEISGEWSGAGLSHARLQPTELGSLATHTFYQFVQVPTFASFVTPMAGALRDATIGIFYNSIQKYEEHFTVPERPLVVDGERITEDAHFGDMRIGASAFGAAGAWVFGRFVSVGGAIVVRRLRIDSEVHSGQRPVERNGTITRDNDLAVGGQVGILVKPASWVSVGAVYHRGTTFHLTTRLTGGFAPDGSSLPVPIEKIRSPIQSIDYRVPTRVTVGSAIRPSPNLTLLGDLGFVRYSERITPNFLIVDFLNQPLTAKLKASDYYFDNAVEVHIGGEYRWLRGSRVIALRAGAFTDPEHQMRFDYAHSFQSPQAQGQFFRFNSLYLGTAYGITGGGGIVLSNRYQIDAAVSLSRNARELVLSSVVRFPR